MGVRELKIMAEARITLNDISDLSPRWSQERLMELLSNAQDDMCRNIPMVVNKATITTSAGIEEYKLPINSVKLLTATSKGYALDITSYDIIEMDNPGWEDDKGNRFSNVIVNALSQQTIRPYPALSDGSDSIQIRVRYSSMPVKLGWDTNLSDSVEELILNEMWDFALKQYIVGMAFLDYGDEASMSRSQIAMGLYTKDYNRADKLAKKSFAKRSIVTGYQAKVASNFYGIGGRYGSRSNRFRY